jgi:hypothetical protein
MGAFFLQVVVDGCKSLLAIVNKSEFHHGCWAFVIDKSSFIARMTILV